MLDRDLTKLYGVETKPLKEDINRFPSDFLFEMTTGEFQNLRSQIMTSSWGASRYAHQWFLQNKA